MDGTKHASQAVRCTCIGVCSHFVSMCCDFARFVRCRSGSRPHRRTFELMVDCVRVYDSVGDCAQTQYVADTPLIATNTSLCLSLSKITAKQRASLFFVYRSDNRIHKPSAQTASAHKSTRTRTIHISWSI